MTRIPQERKIRTLMRPGGHLNAILQAPLTRLPHQAQQQLKPRVPVPEEIPHLLQIRLCHVDQLGQVVGTDQDDVAEPAALQEIADGVPVGTHPVVDAGAGDEIGQFGVVVHVCCFDDDAVCEVAGQVGWVWAGEEGFAAGGLEPVGADDKVDVEVWSVLDMQRRRREVDAGDRVV